MILLRESISLNKDNIKSLPLNESTQMVENSQGKQFKCRGAYTVPISRYDFLNENGRIYEKRLWERVIAEQKNIWEGSSGLMDHPDGEGSVTQEFCVWHNLRLDESNKTVLADMYLFGDFGQNVKEKLDAGGRVELSSSGFGEINESDGQTVIWNTYLLERPADHVLNASQKVWATAKDEINTSTNESITKKVESVNDNITIKEESNNIKENIKMENSDKVIKVHEKSLRLNISNMIKEAKKIENLSEKIDAYKDILNYCDEDFLTDVKEKVITYISECNVQVSKLAEEGLKTPELQKNLEESKTKLTENEEKIKELTQKYEELEKKYELAIKLIDEGKENFEQVKEIVELEKATSNSKVNAEDYAGLVKEHIETGKELEKMKVKNSYLEAKLKKATEAKKKDMREEDDEEMDNEDEKQVKDKKDDKASDSKEKDDDKEDMGKEEKSKKKKESVSTPPSKEKRDEIYLRFDERDKVKDYFNELVETDHRYADYRKDILSCKTLKEATFKALKLKDEIEYELSEGYEFDRKFEEEKEELDERYTLDESKNFDVSKILRKGYF